MQTFWTCFTQFITITMSILASVAIACLTIRHQDQKSQQKANRICEINKQAVLELFRAAIANLMFFLPDCNQDFNRQSLDLYCRKIEAVEQQLLNLSDQDLPDEFIAPFKLNRYKLIDMRLSLYNIVFYSAENPLSSDSFGDLEISELIDSLRTFIADSTAKPL